MDRRILKTNNLIRKALTDLMKQKTFDKITIKDLTEKADINRATFYLHYKDKYDLLEQYQNDILKEIQTIIESVFKTFENQLIPINDANTITPFLTCIYECFKENADFMEVILGNNGDLNFQIKFKNLIENLIVKISIDTNDSKCCIPIKYLIETAASIHIGIIHKWISDGMIETPSELADIVSKLVVSISRGVFN